MGEPEGKLLESLRKLQATRTTELSAEMIQISAELAGISPTDVPTLMGNLAERNDVKLFAGGRARVLPAKPKSESGPTIILNGPVGTFQNAAGDIKNERVSFGVAQVNGPSDAQLAALLAWLNASAPDLQGVAAEAARSVSITVDEAITPGLPVEQKRTLIQKAGTAVKALLDYAPKAKSLAELGEMVEGWWPY